MGAPSRREVDSRFKRLRIRHHLGRYPNQLNFDDEATFMAKRIADGVSPRGIASHNIQNKNRGKMNAPRLPTLRQTPFLP
jgi:hypothetical protein